MVDNHSWHFYLTPAAAWDAMYSDCETAQKSIELEQYIFENDSVGQRFMDLFIRKAKTGVDVFIICDKFGSRAFEGSPQLAELIAAGGHFYFYNYVTFFNWLTPWRWFPRTHVKTLLIDSGTAYAGGVCLAKHMTSWRDTQIRVTGPVTQQIRASFDHVRQRRKAKRLGHSVMPPSHEFFYIESQPLLLRHSVYKIILKTMQEAKGCVFISTAYFAPNRRFRRALRKTARRGIDVRILLPERSDSAIMDWISLSYAKSLLKSGVRLFHYQAEVLHNKTVVIDDDWATVGSSNMDIISFFYNREANVVFTNQEAVGTLTQHFEKDLQQSRELTLDDLHHLSFGKRVIGFIGQHIQSLLRT